MATKFKNIIITGASSGIGEALTEYYAQKGAENIFICGRNAERLEKVAEISRKYKCNVHSKIMDVTDSEQLKAWIEEANQIRKNYPK